MANLDAPKGLQVAGPLLSCRMYKIADTYATTALFIGDPIAIDASGDAIIHTAGSFCQGAALGFFSSEFVPLSTPHLPISTAGVHYVLVADDPRQLFVMQEDSAGGSLALTAIGGNGNMVAGTGSAITGLSAWEIDSSDGSDTTAADTIRFINPLRSPDNAIGTNCKWIVRINNHSGSVGIVGVGI